MTARTNWFDGQRVFQDALTHVQTVFIAADKNRVADFFSTPGTVNGLTVGANNTLGSATVFSGVGYDGNGDRVYVPSYINNIFYNGVSLNAVAGTYSIIAKYAESNDGVYSVDPSGNIVYTHITDSYSVLAKKQGTDSINTTLDIVLGIVSCSSQWGSLTAASTGRQVVALKTFS